MPRALKPKPIEVPTPPVEAIPLPLDEGDDDVPEFDEAKFQEASDAVKEKYFETIGRRKESVARVRLFTRKSSDEVRDNQALMTVNGKSYMEYFRNPDLWAIIEGPLRKLKSLNRFKVTVVVRGGGTSGQADAVRHGIARALELFDANFRKKLKKSGFLKRDPREKERRKYGHKKARKSGRWSKR